MKIKQKINAKSSSCYKRNEAILFRHYFYSKVKRLNKEAILDNLNQEFFISKCTIQEILYDNKNYIKELRRKQVSLEYLDEKYSFFKWNL